LVINWLKHYKPEDPDPVVLSEYDAVMTLGRAITKFIAAYHQSTTLMEGFLQWAVSEGYPLPSRIKQPSALA
jgi:hypothetical protein